MPLFDWFSRKKPPPVVVADDESSGLGHVDATVPLPSAAAGLNRTATSAPGSAANRKSERLARREQLYAIIRESMTRAGILSSSYKFKVLSLDSRGRQYLVMMDLPRGNAAETSRLAEIEGLIAKSAKTRFDIVVTAVYWRVNEHVTAGLTTANASKSAPKVFTNPSPELASAKPRFDPLQQDEVVAFKNALASASSTEKTTPLGVEHRSTRKNPMPPALQFRDTELDEPQSPLSGTQYGDLN